MASRGESSHGCNAAHVVVIASHPDVSGLTPVGTPGVLDDPVGRSGAGSPADGQDSVVQLGGRAVGVGVDSRGVELERGLRGVDGDGCGSRVDGGLECVLVSRSDVGERGQGGSRVGGGVGACSVLGGVWVAGLGVNASVGDDVLHGLGHQSSVASLVSLRPRAIHEVLFGQRDEFLCSQEVASLGRSGGRERPARSALLLVLDGSDCSLGGPVERVGQSGATGCDSGTPVSHGGGVHLNSEEKLGKLNSCQVSELVHGDGEVHSTLVVCINVQAVLGPNGETGSQVGGTVNLSVLVGPSQKLGVVATQSQNGRNEQNCNNQNSHFL